MMLKNIQNLFRLINEIDSKIKTDLENRFEKIEWMSTTKTANFLVRYIILWMAN